MLKSIKWIILILVIFSGLESLKLLLAQEQNLEPQKKYSREDIKKRMLKEKDRIPLYIEMLEDPSWVTRERAILILSRSKDARAIEPLARVMVEDPDQGIRKMTAGLLSGFNDKRIVPIFKKQVLENGLYKNLGATVLIKLGNKEEKELALPIIEKHAEEGHPRILFYEKIVPQGSTIGMQKIYYDKERAKIIMNKLLNHKDELVRAEAVYYLHDMGDKDIVQGKIEDILKSENPRVKNIGKSILKKIGDEKSKKKLQELEYQELQKELKEAEQKRDKK